MKSLYVLAVFLLPFTTQAFIAIETDQSQPYENVPVEASLGEERFYLGELTGYPIMYEVVAEDSFTFTAQVRQVANKVQQPFSLIIVRLNDRGGGVREIARMSISPDEWKRDRDSQAGMTFAESPILSEAVEPGIYRIEISTPENIGKYMLQIGGEPADTGYWEQLGAVRTTQRWFGHGGLSILGSSLVFYPLGITLLVFAFYKTWRYRRTFRNPQADVSA